MFREKARVRWTGPYKITKIEGKQAVIDRNGTEVQHSISQLKPYVRDSEEHAELHCSVLHSVLFQFKSDNDDLHDTDDTKNAPWYLPYRNSTSQRLPTQLS